MKFAAGLTVTGILGFLLMEIAKLIMPAIAAGIVAFLALVVKILLIALVVMVAAAVLGIGYFFYKRGKKHEVEV